mgnify:CR=1 FL=1
MIWRILLDLFLLSLTVAVLAGIILIGSHKAYVWYQHTQGEPVMDYFRRGASRVRLLWDRLVDNLKSFWDRTFRNQ